MRFNIHCIFFLFQVHYKFDCGSGPALLIGENTSNDNQWHTVIFKRTENHGELLIDDDSPITGSSAGNTKQIDVGPPFYVGGVRSDLRKNVLLNTVSKD